MELREQHGWFQKESRVKHLRTLLDQAGINPVNLEIERAGRPLTLTIPATPACSYDVLLAQGDTANAMTDGEKVAVMLGMMRFVRSDDELALVVSHELAHAMLGHLTRMRGNQLLGGLLGALVDVGLAAAGVNTGGAATRAGMGAGALAFSQDFEMEADYLGLYLAARAGYKVSEAAEFFRRMGIEHPASIRENFSATHPSTPERAAAIQETIKEIEMKMARGEHLVPKVKAEITSHVKEGTVAEGRE